ncbi:deoxyribodipyrimidine photo-lyase, partial [bacterium]|nr:deoxyribodipyrimidine photo-lyase [bacterium]
MQSNKGLVWIRRDIRLHDHPALSRALDDCAEVHLAFVFDDAILAPLKVKSVIDRRVQFIAESIAELDAKIRRHGGSIHIQYGDPKEKIPELIRELKIDRLYLNRDYSPYAVSRDTAVTAEVERLGAKVILSRDHVVFEPEEILTKTGTPYAVFTPYSNAWQSALARSQDRLDPYPVRTNRIAGHPNTPPLTVARLLEIAGFEPVRNDLPGGTSAGLKRLDAFINTMSDYTTARDYFGQDGTSKLSVYLRHGCVSIRDMVNAALSNTSDGANKWLSELIWREFYQMIFHYYPWVNDTPFQTRYREIQWPTSEAYLAAFKNGQTGFPIIDAAMRCLNQTGWMHNRLRMVTA